MILQYDFFYQEHFSYYTITSLIKFLHKYDLEIFDIKKIAIHSGSIRVYAKNIKNKRLLKSKRSQKLLEKEEIFFKDNKSIDNFKNKVAKQKIRLETLLMKLKNNNKKIVGYGAAGRGNTLLNICQINTILLDYIVDESPERYGRYTPGTHIPIVDPKKFRADNPDFVLLLAWNYTTTILAKEKKFIENGGKFILPLPKVKFYRHKNTL